MSTVVLHNLPVGCMESDIHRALLIYGTAVNIEMDTRTSQAVVTMRTRQEAQALLNRHSVNVSGTSVRVDTQQSQPVPPPPLPPQPQQHAMPATSYPYAAAQGAMYTGIPSGTAPTPSQQLQQPYYPTPGVGVYGGGGGAPLTHLPTGGGSGGNAIMPAPPQTSRRLKVVVEDCRYPITREVLMRMFSMIAPPVMVTCGPYGPTTVGTVEFAEAAAAQQAVDQFHSKAIYPDCCYVKLTFEPMWEVPAASGYAANPATTTPPAVGAPNVSHYLYQGQSGMPGNANLYSAGPNSNADVDPRYQGWGSRESGNGADPMYYGDNRGAYQRPSSSSMEGRDHGYLSGGDDGRREYITGGGRGIGGRGSGGGEGPRGLMVRGGRGAARDAMRGGATAGFSPYNTSSFPPHHPSAPARATAEQGGAVPGVGGRPAAAQPPVSDCAVLIWSVNESVSLYDLWVLLEVYGNVKSLKRQHSDRSQVVAQFQHATDTVLVVQYLHGCPFRGTKLRLKRFLGYQERGHTEWNLGPPSDPSTLAVTFETGYHHRVAPHVPRNPRSAMYPDKNLFVSNLTDEVADSELEEVWRRLGFEPTATYRRGPRASIVGFKDVETAVNALVAVHLQDCHGRTLYATFSRFPPEPRPAKPESEGEERSQQDGEQDGEPESDHEEAEQGEEQAEQPVLKPASPPPPAPSAEATDETVTASSEEAQNPTKTGRGKAKAAKK